MYKCKQNTEKLHRAIQVGQLQEVTSLINNGADMNYVLGMRGTALCAAIEARSYDAAQCLLEAGCDVNAKDFDGEPPLLLALRKALPLFGCHGKVGAPNQTNIIPLIINHPQCDLNKIDPLTKTTALHFAVTEGMHTVVKWLIDSKSAVALNVNTKDSDGNTPLHIAVSKNNAEIVKLVIDHPECLTKVTSEEKSFMGYPINIAGLSPMHICARSGQFKFMELLIKRLVYNKKHRIEHLNECSKVDETELGMNLNLLTKFERESCLHIACRNGHLEMVKLLLDFGAMVNERNNMNNTPLLLSLVSPTQWQTMSNEIPGMLLKRGANPNVKSMIHNTGYVTFDLEVTPMIIASLNNNVELAKQLVTHGADVNGADSMGRTPLYTALWENAPSVALFLLRECPNVNVNIKLKDNTTCLHAMVKLRCPDNPSVVEEIVKHLFQHGASIEKCDSGETPVELAIDYENPLLLDAILNETDSGAYSIDKETLLSALSTSAENGLLDIIRVLLCHGADIDSQPFLMTESPLYIALKNSQMNVATFLVNNGIDLRPHEEWLRFQRTNIKCCITDSVGLKDADFDSASDISEQSDSDSSIDSDNDALTLDSDTLAWITSVQSNPRKLELNCLVYIRKHFLANKIPFKRVEKLNLPKKLKDMIRYRETNGDVK